MTSSRIFKHCRRLVAGLLWGGVATCPSAALSEEMEVISATATDPSTHEIWIGTWGNGLYRQTAGRLDRFDQFNSGLAGNIVFDVLYVGGRVWAATNGGLSVYDPTRREWELHFARRGDGRDTAITDLTFAKPFVSAKIWKGPTLQFDLERREWHEIEHAADIQANTAESPCFPTPPHHPPLDHVALAVFLQAHRTIALPHAKRAGESGTDRPDLLAVQWALERQNEIRAQKNITPFELVTPTPGYASYGWGLPEDEFIAFARRSDVMGVVAKIAADRAIADAVFARTGLPVVNVAGRENAGNPWVFRCAGGEPRQWRRMLNWLRDDRGVTRFAAVVGPDEAWRRRVDRWKEHVENQGMSWGGEVVWDQSAEAADSAVESLRRMDVVAVLSGLSRHASAAFLRRMRELNLRLVWAGAEDLVSDEFVNLVSPGVGDVVALAPEVPIELGTFAEAFSERERRAPDETAFASMLATDHLLAAMETAGPSRDKVREALHAMEHSAAGELHYETLVPLRPVGISVLQEGQWIRRELPP